MIFHIRSFIRKRSILNYGIQPEGNATQGNSNVVTSLFSTDIQNDKNKNGCEANSKYDQKFLLKENDRLRKDVKEKKSTIEQLIKSEEKLRSRLTSYAKKEIDKNGKYEDINQLCRSTKLIEQYNILYSQTRLDALDSLIDLDVISDRLKSRILFSIIVLAYRAASAHANDIRNQIQKLLQISSTSNANDIVDALNQHLKATVDTFDIRKIEKTVEYQLWTALYEYPDLRSSESLIRYLNACCRISWSLVNQIPAYRIDINQRVFNKDLHERFHTSTDENSTVIQEYVWPSLIDLLDNECVSKGIVITRKDPV